MPSDPCRLDLESNAVAVPRTSYHVKRSLGQQESRPLGSGPVAGGVRIYSFVAQEAGPPRAVIVDQLSLTVPNEEFVAAAAALAERGRTSEADVAAAVAAYRGS